MNQIPVKTKNASLEKAPFVVTWLLSLFVVSFPIFDCDLYWHLANGRAMVSARRIINEDVLSFTHFGAGFVNHEWLSQTVFYLIWDRLGPNWLWIFKLLLCSLVVFFLYRAVRAVRGGPWLAALLCVLAVLAGIQRYHVRPELFTLLNMATLGYLLHGFRGRTSPRHRLWIIPVLFVVWDWLHGAIVGLTFFAVFTAAENIKVAIPALRRRAAFTSLNIKALNICFASTIVAMITNPYGLRSYGHFMVLATGAQGADKIVELQKIWQAAGDYVPFLLMLVWAVALIVVDIRNFDLTDIALVFVFGGGAIYYSRLVGASAIVLVPIIARSVGPAVSGNKGGAVARGLSRAGVVIAGAVLVISGFNEKILGRSASITPQGTYVLPSATAFGYSVNEFLTPGGSVRFMKDMGLQGNMYNNANLGGYIAFLLVPGQRIFQYNMPPIFGDTTRFVRNPRGLDRWRIEYAFAGSVGELTRLFPSSRWARVYSDYVSTLVVRRTPLHQALIDKYEIKYFLPEQSEEDYIVLAENPVSRARLAFEMGVYLKYMTDGRIARRWEQLLTQHQDLTHLPSIRELIRSAAGPNESLRGLSEGLAL